MAEPQDFPLAGDDSITPITWAEGGTATEPSSGRKDTGWLNADVVTMAELNWLSREPMRVLRALFSRYPKASDMMFASWLVPNGNGVWSDTGVGALEGFLSDAGLADSKVADIWLNPKDIDTGAVRLQVRVAKASPHTFTASRDTYVFVPIDVVTPPTATLTDLVFDDVPIDDPQPSTPAGTVPVWRVRTDGSGITDQEILLPQIPSFLDFGVDGDVAIDGALVVTGALELGGSIDITGNLVVQGNSTLGNAGGDSHTITGTVGITGATTVTGSLTVASDNPLNVTGNVTAGSDSADAFTCHATANFNAPVTVANGQTFTANGNVVLGNAGSDTLTCNAAATFNTTLVANGAISALAGINLSNQTISGSSGSLVAAESMAMLEQRWTDSVGTLSSVAGRTRWNGTFWSFRDANTVARTFDEPTRGYDATFTGVNAIDDTTCSTTRRIQAAEPVRIKFGCRAECAAAPGTLNYRLKVTGPLGTADLVTSTIRMEVAAHGYILYDVVDWVPTDTFGAETDPQNYVFLVRLGRSAAGDLTATRIWVEAVSALVV